MSAFWGMSVKLYAPLPKLASSREVVSRRKGPLELRLGPSTV